MKEVLHWDEYKKATYPDELLKDDPSNPHFKAMSIMLKRSEKRWTRCDQNSDTVLTKEEFTNFIHPEESDKHKEILVEEAMEDMDPNKDGQVTLDEYMTHMTEMTEEVDRSEPDWEQVCVETYAPQLRFQTCFANCQCLFVCVITRFVYADATESIHDVLG